MPSPEEDLYGQNLELINQKNYRKKWTLDLTVKPLKFNFKKEVQVFTIALVILHQTKLLVLFAYLHCLRAPSRELETALFTCLFVVVFTFGRCPLFFI